MFQKFEVSGVHTSIDESLHDYVNKKIGGLDRYISRHSRDSAHCEVFLKENKGKGSASFTCEVTLYLPHQTVVVKENAQSLYAAVDEAEAKAKVQLKKYKDTHESSKFQRHLIARFRRRSS
jgi:putative sigma-54 modulation protein